jgi:hypothetical protein
MEPFFMHIFCHQRCILRSQKKVHPKKLWNIKGGRGRKGIRSKEEPEYKEHAFPEMN